MLFEKHKKKLHSGLYKCVQCEYSFSSAKDLQNHVDRVHLKIKRKKCEFCDISYFSEIDLFIHIRSHTGKRPFGCERCFKCYTSSNSISHHVKLKHR